MAYTFSPRPDFKWSVKKGDRGEEVAALQINLRLYLKSTLLVDGDFGPATDAAVREVQQDFGIKIDGVAGPTTDRYLVLALSHPAEKSHRLPLRLLEGLLENESGFIIPAYSPHPSDPGFDLGPYQDSLVPGQFTQARFARAYNAQVMAGDTAAKLRTQFIRFFGFGIVNKRRAWELAALYHNWPVAAERLAKGLSISPDPARDDKPADWVISASGGRLRTPREWVDSYIAKATKYVQWD